MDRCGYNDMERRFVPLRKGWLPHRIICRKNTHPTFIVSYADMQSCSSSALPPSYEITASLLRYFVLHFSFLIWRLEHASLTSILSPRTLFMKR